MRAKKSSRFLESEAHVSALINCNLMGFNEMGFYRKLFKPVLILMALYFGPKINPTEVERLLIYISSKKDEIRTCIHSFYIPC